MDYKNIITALASLKEKDAGLKAFGAAGHHYQLNAPLSLQTIEAFEQKHNIQLPADYREFLLQAGDGGAGPFYGLRTLEESAIDFKLKDKPAIDIQQPFPYTDQWNEAWIEQVDWENGGLPEDEQSNRYMNVDHIRGCLEVCHYGHGCTFLLVVNGPEKGNIWFDGRADYGGLQPELDEQGQRLTFSGWYSQWLESKFQQT